MSDSSTQPGDASPPADKEYESLLLLDDLESLLEELEEFGVTGEITGHKLPPDLTAQAQALGVKSVGELRDRIAAIHRSLDRADHGL